MAQLEPMDVDDLNDNKENAFIPNNVIRGAENTELLDSSEYNMKLRYSTTPVSSPMSKSYTVVADKNIDDANNCNMTRSLNLTVTKSDSTFTGPKSLPLQTIPSGDTTINVLNQLDNLISDDGNVTISVSEALEDNENISLPSSSSVTPEAVTPTKEVPKPVGSPILRGIQSVFNMFRASHSPVFSNDDDENVPEDRNSLEYAVDNTENVSITASTPLNAHRKSDSMSSRDRENTVFNEKLEKDLEWNETTIIFSKEKFPIHKLLFPQSNIVPLPDSSTVGDVSMASVNQSCEAMDISCIDSGLNNKTLQGNNVTSTLTTENMHSNEITGSEKDESVFLDCETTFNESHTKHIDKSNSRTQEKTLNNTSFISMQSAETVTCTSDMTENLIVSQSFVEPNTDIHPIADISLDNASEAGEGTESGQISCEINIKSEITKTSDEHKINTDKTDCTVETDSVQCHVNFCNESLTEVNSLYDVSSTDCVKKSHKTIISNERTKGNDQETVNLTNTDEDDDIQCPVETPEEKHTELIVKDQHDDTSTESAQESPETVFESRTVKCGKNETKIDENNKKVINISIVDILKNDENKTDEQTEPQDAQSVNINLSVTSQGEENVPDSKNYVSDESKISKEREQRKEDTIRFSQDELVKPPSPGLKNEADTSIDALSIPTLVDIKPDGSLIITTDDKEAFEIPTTTEDISMVKADMLVTDDEQELSNDTASEKDVKIQDVKGEQNIAATCENKNANQDNKMQKSIDSQCKEEEIIISESNSPYVSLGVEVTETESVKKDSDTASELQSTPHKSPKITSVGYNFNFDEIENPFVTKTRLSISPTRQVAISKPNKSLVVSQIIESFPKISEALSETPVINKVERVTTEANTTVILEDKVTTSGTFTPEAIATDNESKKDHSLECETPEILPLEVNNDSNVTGGELSTNECAAYAIASSPLSNQSSIEVNAQIISSTSQFYSMGSSSCEIKEAPCTTSEINDSFKNSQCESLTNHLTTAKVDQQAVEQNTHELDSRCVQSNENKVNAAEVPDNVSDISIACSDDKDITVREVHTEDEDTAEGPVIESQLDSKEDCFSGFVSVKSDCGVFDDLPPEAKDEDFEPIESAEMFIDAEAFDFLMSQNRSNEVISSGKESLFLKFDPLFAKRVNSDGVLDILSKVQKRQSTPKKLKQHQSIMDMSNEEKPGPSSANRTFDVQALDTPVSMRLKPQLSDFDETLCDSYLKPTMIVTPVVPRTNLKTPSRSVRRSSGVHSPAIAVIDRLLSISANNSIAYDDEATVMHYNAEQEEADRALIELRDLVSAKELEVYQLKSETKELKDRLFTLESQMENLDREGEKRLKSINALNQQLNEKDKMNKSMKDVVEEYEKTIAGLIAEIESDKKRNAEEKMQLIRERDEQTAHLANMEGAFSDLHSKYEKSKQIILSYKTNEDAYKKSIDDFEASLNKMEKTYDALKEHATAQLDHANQELEKINKSHESEVVKLKAMIKRKDLHITSLEENIAQKIKANEELTAICDELISKVG